MTLTLTPDTETRLRTFAEEQGQDLTELHETILARWLEEAEARREAEALAEWQDTLAGLDQSVEDMAAGRWITAEEMDQRLTARAAEIRSAQTLKEGNAVQINAMPKTAQG